MFVFPFFGFEGNRVQYWNYVPIFSSGLKQMEESEFGERDMYDGG